MGTRSARALSDIVVVALTAGLLAWAPAFSPPEATYAVPTAAPEDVPDSTYAPPEFVSSARP